MSQYPYGGYNQYPSQQPQHLYNYQSFGAYPPPVYSNQPATPTPTTEIPFAAPQQTAFSYNASVIPGLSALGTPTNGAPFQPSINGGAWGQGGFGSGPSPVSAFRPQYPNYNPPTQTSPVQKPYPPVQFQTPAPPNSTSFPRNTYNQAKEDTAEEGELSDGDGEFDDLYEPRDDVVAQSAATQQPQACASSSASRPGSAADAQEPDFYDTEVEEVAGSSGQPGLTAGGQALNLAKIAGSEVLTSTGRGRSGSYSPYLSPRELPTPDNENHTGISQAGQHVPRPQGVGLVTSVVTETTVQKGADGLEIPKPQEVASQVTSATTKPPTLSFSTLPEAKKEASKAILRLLPHGVKLQTYLDEGFDDRLVKGLFNELNLVPSSNSSPAQQPSTTQAPKEKQAQDQQVPPGSKVDAMAKNQEERKDRIARLLAEKAAKSTAAGGTTAQTLKPKTLEASAIPTVPGSVSTAGNKASMTKADKDLLLQQKMEALKKSRAAQAHKVGPVLELKQDTSPPTTVQTEEPANIVPLTTGTAPATVQVKTSLASNRSLPSVLHSAPIARVSTPGLSFPSMPSQQLKQRKRPVASDFSDYPTAAIKRPFLPERQNSSLVIDVSDESEDDEDVEMEMDSAGEDSSGSNQNTFTLPQRGPSIRDYPPLTNTRFQRQPSNPASGAPKSPYTVNGRAKETEYEAKMRQIAEYKKMIDERVAKVKAKQGTATPRTPSAGISTPPEPEVTDVQSIQTQTRRAVSTSGLSAADSATAPSPQQTEPVKLPESSDISTAERDVVTEPRLRIPSVQLPRVEVDLEKQKKMLEKKNKMKLLQDELMKLQAELEDEEAEKKPLSDDIGELSPESAEYTVSNPQLDRQQQADIIFAAEADELATDGENTDSAITSTDSKDPIAAAEVQAQADTGSTSMSFDDLRNEAVLRSQHMEIKAASGSHGGSQSIVTGIEGYSTVSRHVTPTTAPEAPFQHATSNNSEMESGEVSHSPVDIPGNHEVVADKSADATVVPVDENASGHQESSDTAQAQKVDKMVLDSPPFSPAPAGATTDNNKIESDMPQDTMEPSLPMPTQISTAVISTNDPALEEHAETVHAVREVPVVSVPDGSFVPNFCKANDVDATGPGAQSSFAPYESPLRCFHSYRFHPSYNDTVSGGLKSLTYSNRIDANREICPEELDGQGCPRGTACEFQHFRSMVAPDDQIILELGNSDEYTGERKNNFNAGLRELLAKFRVQKVRDFRTIAEGVVEFRRRFVGDSSKVLPLEGVGPI